MSRPLAILSTILLSSALKRGAVASGTCGINSARNLTTNKMAAVPVIKLCNSEVQVPVLGYGTWQAKDEELESAIEKALEAGYRHIDTATVYENEKVIGRVLNRWISSGKVNRKDLFIVTKLPPSGMRASAVEKFLKKSLQDLQVDYLDLYLVHVPFGFRDVEGDLHPMKDGKIDMDTTTDHLSIWKAMEKQLESGLVKSIGISNFNKTQIQRILNNCTHPPQMLQIELHAYNQQKELVDFCKQNKIAITAYSPLGSPGLAKFFAQFGKKIDLPDILGNPTVMAIAKKHNKSEAQILLRHTIQRGLIAIPKSTNAQRLRINLDIFDFELDKKDMMEMENLDQKLRILDFSAFNGIKDHPEYPFRE